MKRPIDCERHCLPMQLPVLLIAGVIAGCGPVNLGSVGDGGIPVDAPASVSVADAAGPAPDLAEPPDSGGVPGSWTVVFNAPDSLWAVWGSGRNDVFACGALGAIYHSANGGKTWQGQASNSTEALRAIWGSGAMTYIAGSNSTHLVTPNSGQTWSPISLTAGTELNGIWGSSASDYYLVGDRILHTIDGGKHFSEQTTAGHSLFTVWGSGPGDVFAAGSGISDAELVHSDNGGLTWSPQTIALQTFSLLGIWGSGKDNVLAVGWTFTPIQTHNGGASWTQVSAPPATYRSIWGSGPMDIYIGTGGAERIEHSTNGGATWTMERQIEFSQDVTSIWGSAADDVYAVTANGAILHRNP